MSHENAVLWEWMGHELVSKHWIMSNVHHQAMISCTQWVVIGFRYAVEYQWWWCFVVYSAQVLCFTLSLPRECAHDTCQSVTWGSSLLLWREEKVNHLVWCHCVAWLFLMCLYYYIIHVVKWSIPDVDTVWYNYGVQRAVYMYVTRLPPNCMLCYHISHTVCYSLQWI